jgi:sporulation protein YlmC with PRC-barrel domain
MSHTNGAPKVLSASTLIGDTVKNPQGEKLGKVEEIMLDLDFGRVSYAVLSFGGFLGIGDKLFAIPFEKLRIDGEDHCCVLDVDKAQLEAATGFDKDHWPNFADREWGSQVYGHYGTQVYW